MNTLNTMNRRILVLLAVMIMATVTAVPAFATSSIPVDVEGERIGIADVVYKGGETLRLRVVETKTESGKLRYTPVDGDTSHAYPRYPMWYYTCYFEGVKIPCSFLAWLW